MDTNTNTNMIEAASVSESESKSKSLSTDTDMGTNSHIKWLESRESFPYFIREMTALTMLNKAGVPHVVQLKSVKPDGSLELERYDGDLYDVEDTALETEEQVMYTVYQVLVTMNRFQQLNLSHRDIKPENILSSKDGKQLALCDFGLTRYYSNGHYPDQTTSGVQTAFYRSPELMFQDIIDEIPLSETESDLIGKVNPKNMDIWSLGITALKLLELNDFLPPQIAKGELTLMELYDSYIWLFGSESINYGENSPFLQLIKDMLTINSDMRPDSSTLLSNPIFDCYRDKEPPCTTDFTLFEQTRVSNLLKVLPETENDVRVRKHLHNIAHYHFNNVESASLAVCILYLLPEEERVSVDIMTVIALAAAIFDTEIIDMSISKTLNILAKLDYDIMLPVMHNDIVQRLAKLFKTV